MNPPTIFEQAGGQGVIPYVSTCANRFLQYTQRQAGVVCHRIRVIERAFEIRRVQLVKYLPKLFVVYPVMVTDAGQAVVQPEQDSGSKAGRETIFVQREVIAQPFDQAGSFPNQAFPLLQRMTGQ